MIIKRERERERERERQGVGAKRGMEVIAHLCTSLYQDGFAMVKLDATTVFKK